MLSLEEVITILPRSYDLTACWFFLWGDVKDTVFTKSPASIQNPKYRISKAIEDIGQPHYVLVFENFMKRIWTTGRSRSVNLADVIIHSSERVY